MEKSLRLYQQLIGEVEAAMAPLLARHRGTLRCAPGCDACCQALSLLPIEALVVHRALQTLPEEMRQQCRRPEEQAGTACPFLPDLPDPRAGHRLCGRGARGDRGFRLPPQLCR